MKFAITAPHIDSSRHLDGLLSQGLKDIAWTTSGQPWLFTDSPNDWYVRTVHPGLEIALPADYLGPAIDQFPTTSHDVDELDDLADQVAKTSFFVANVDGVLRVQGTLCTRKQVFWSAEDGIPVASNKLSVLHKLIRPKIDRSALALYLMPSLPQQPLADRTHWEGINAVFAGNWLRISGSSARNVRWWSDPGRDLEFEEGAAAVRSSLNSALLNATAKSDIVSSDLSGGMDSTSLCFVLHALGRTFAPFRTSSLSASNDETRRAHGVAQSYGWNLRELRPLAEYSSTFDLAPETSVPALYEGPIAWAASRRYLDDLALAIAESGSNLHFTGLGGDELFDYMPGTVRSLWLESAPRSLAIIRHLQTSRRIKGRTLLRAAIRGDSYQQTLKRVSLAIQQKTKANASDRYSWIPPIEIPHWFSDEGRALVIEKFATIAAQPPEPLGNDPLAQQTIESITFQGGVLRQLCEVYAASGIDWQAPLTDIGVLRAVLRSRASARFHPYNDKPLLAAAVGSDAPHDFYRKRRRGDFTTDVHVEHGKRRRALFDEFSESALADLGIVDHTAVRAAVYEPSSTDLGLFDAEHIVTAERWLRSVGKITGSD